MKLHILSDVHNEFSVLEPPDTAADVVILAGDIDVGLRAIPWAAQLDKPVIYVAGNHEFYKRNYDELVQGMREQTNATNVHFLEQDEVVVDGIRFLGGVLWTDFRVFGDARYEEAKRRVGLALNDFRLIKKGPDSRLFNPDDAEAAFHETVAFFETKLAEPFDGKTVIVTHHAPSLQSSTPWYKNDIVTAGFASDLRRLMSQDIALWVHGHMHNNSDYRYNDTRVVCNPRGYQRPYDPVSENREFDPAFVVEI